MKYFDVHTHTNFHPLSSQAKEIADEALAKEIYYVDVGTNVDTSATAIKHANESINVYATVGLHPNDLVNTDIGIAFEQIESLLIENKKIVAIGETGLDYHYEDFDKNLQSAVFVRHIELARKYQLPLMIHVRDAHADVLQILKEKAEDLKIIIHCFTGDTELVKKYAELNCYISINGAITFKNAQSLRDAIKFIPSDRLLSETDAPWLSPEPNRGRINVPTNVPQIVSYIARVLGKDEAQLANELYENALVVFNLK